LTEAETNAWRELAERAVEPNPFSEPGCLIPAARHLSSGADISLVIAEEDGRFFGCFPTLTVPAGVRPSTSWRGVRRAAFTTEVLRVHYDGTPLLNGERGVEAAMALLSALGARDRNANAGILVLEKLDADGPVSSCFVAAAAALRLPICTYHSWSRPMVRRREELTYRQIHGADTLQKLERKRLQLGEKLGGEVRLVDRSADASAIDNLIAIESAGWKGRAGVALASHPGEPEWLRELCDRFRSEHRLLLYCLQVRDTVLAMKLMVRGGEGLFSVSTVYDENYAHYSPGNQLLLETIDRFHEKTDARWIDTCTYEGNTTYLLMYPDRRTVSTVVLAVGGRVDRAWLRTSLVPYRLFGADSAFRRRHRCLIRALDRMLAALRIAPD
jgi:hypothetical protein